MNIFVISDTHFNHENIKLYEGRPDDHVEQIISNWNKVVQHDDMVIHLGDVIMGQGAAEKLPGIMASLPGKKILCRGNHDFEKKWGTGKGFMERGFDFVCDYFVYDQFAFSHVPLTPLPTSLYQLDEENDIFVQREVQLNIHGHFHRKIPTGPGGNFQRGFYDSKYYWENRAKYQLVHIEDTFRPLPLKEVVATWLSEKGGEEK